jgi:hypothetical protein
MRIIAEDGLWTTGVVERALPLVMVLEVSGAVMSWTVDEQGPPRIVFTDVARADWLWRVVGEHGHVTIAAATDGPPVSSHPIDVDGTDVAPQALGIPRRLAMGHWLRRWWPAGIRDGIVALDVPLLDAEIAVLTAAAQDFFSDDTLDSDVAALLSPHAGALGEHVRSGDPRVIDLVVRCVELVEDIGVSDPVHEAKWADLSVLIADPTAFELSEQPRQDDYALAAGGDAGSRTTAIAEGAQTIRWGGVPAGVFDAGEGTIGWSVRADPDVAVLVSTVVASGSDPTGIAVSVRSGMFNGSAILGPDGQAKIGFDGATGERMTETQAWAHDWSTTSVTVGVPVEETLETRDRVRSFAHRRLSEPGPDAFLVEILAAEADY